MTGARFLNAPIPPVPKRPVIRPRRRAFQPPPPTHLAIGGTIELAPAKDMVMQ